MSARTLAAGYMTGRSGAAEGLSAAERKMEEPLRSSGRRDGVGDLSSQGEE